MRQPSTPESLRNAKTSFESAIELDNRFSLAYAGLCETHLANYRLTRAAENFEAAELACHRALTLDGGLAEVYTALGNLYRHSGQYDDAEQEYETALEINPMLEEANFGLGRTYQAQGRLEQAEETLRRSIDLEPGFWGAHLGFGNFLHRQGRYAEAVPFYETVTELAPNYVGGFINLGSALHWLGDWDAAEIAWRRSLELEPDSMAYQNLGTLHYYQHRYDDAVKMHKKAVEIAPSDHRAWGKLAAAERYAPGQMDASLASYGRAIELVEEQLAINPDDAEDLSSLASYLANTGDLQGSRRAAERALSLAPESPNTHYFTAILEMHSGNEERALMSLAKATELGYSSRLVSEDPEFAELRQRPTFIELLENNNK